MHGSSLRDRDNPTTKASRRSVQGVSASCCMLLSQRGLLFAGLSYLVSLGFFWWCWLEGGSGASFLFVLKRCVHRNMFLTFLPGIWQEILATHKKYGFSMVPTLLGHGRTSHLRWKALSEGREEKGIALKCIIRNHRGIFFRMLYHFSKNKIPTSMNVYIYMHGFISFDLAYFHPPY